jgi:hypothetical protein
MPAATGFNGLTLLAIMNFVMAGIFGLFALSMLLFLCTVGLPQPSHLHGPSPLSAFRQPWLLSGGLLIAVLLLVSGLGYLHHKLVQGRYLGNAYALLALVWLAVAIHYDHHGLTLATITPLIYPLLTLALINVAFKNRLVG